MPESNFSLAPKDDILLAKVRPFRPAVAPVAHGFSRSDIVFALFRHKVGLVVATVVGLAAAVTAYFLYPPTYQSQAKLLVRYLVERSTVDPMDNSGSAGGLVRSTDNIIGSEVEILTSWDLAVQVAEAIGPKRLLPHSNKTVTKEGAARTIVTGLEVTTHPGRNIIFVSYKNSDPELATLVLTELVNRYFNKHLEVHRSAGAFDFVTQQTDQVRARLSQTEDALKAVKEKSGIVSLENSTASLSSETARIEEQLHEAEAELAEQRARVSQLSGPVVQTSDTPAASAGGKGTPSAGPDELPPEVLEQYQSLVSRLPQLRQAKMELLAKFTPQNQIVQSNLAEIAQVEKERRDLEKKFPELPARVAPISNGRFQQMDPASEAARLAGLQAKQAALSARLREIEQKGQQLTQISPQIADLERQRGLEETNYKYFQGTLEKARVDEALDPSKIPNISAVQRPSPPMMVTSTRDHLAFGIAGGGVAAGLIWALLLELVFNRSIRRSVEIERYVGVTPLLSIPRWSPSYDKINKQPGTNGHNGHNGHNAHNGASERSDEASGQLAPWDSEHFIHSYCEAIRDRIVLEFELNKLTHKPKLVGVASVSQRSGASTLAAGLAAALSETGDGKVLLVDVNLGPEHVHPFFKGRPAYSLKMALQKQEKIDSAMDNLYLATVGAPNAGPAQLGLKKFFELMPNLRASDFDYIIFDMPELAQTSPTMGMSGFMDKLLLVVEAEQSNRDAVRRGYSSLVSIRNNVSLVLNKTRERAPKWVDGEL